MSDAWALVVHRLLRGGVAILAMVILPQCAPPQTNGTFRDADVTLAGSTRFTPQAFAGAWVMRQHFPSDVAPDSMTFSYQAPLAKMKTPDDMWTGTLERFGRMKLRSDTQNIDLVVLWVDEGFRTAAIGTLDGSLGWVIDRNAGGGADRIKAAREIMSFNGYDISKLRVVRR